MIMMQGMPAGVPFLHYHLTFLNRLIKIVWRRVPSPCGFFRQSGRKIMSAVFERVQKILMKQLNMDEDQVTGDALFVDDLGADSIDSVELMMAF